MKRKKLFSAYRLRTNKASAVSPDDFPREMMALFHAGEWRLFEQKARDAVRRWPASPLGWKALGNLFLKRGRYEAALKPLAECVQLAPDDPQALNNLGSALLKLRRFGEAEEKFRRALSLKADYAEALTNLGTALLESGKIEEALACHLKALAIRHDFALAHNNLGNVYKEKGDFARARESYVRALAANPNLPEANTNLALIIEGHFADMQEAGRYYHQAVACGPSYAPAHLHYGIFLVNHDVAEGLTHLERAGQLQPELMNNLQTPFGKAYLKFGRRNEAISCFAKALQQNPDDVYARYFLSIAKGKMPDRKTRTEYVKDLFNTYSGKFDNHLVDRLEYKVPVMARELIEEIYGAGIKFRTMADLGCGTGLGGIAFRDCTEQIIGIDLSGDMLARAAEKGVYDELLQGEITQVLGNVDRKFDFFLATDVVVYFQELDNLFASIRKKAAPGALLVFSTEWFDGEGFAVSETGRTAHSSGYIRALAENFALRSIKDTRLPIRKGKGGWIEGELYILTF